LSLQRYEAVAICPGRELQKQEVRIQEPVAHSLKTQTIRAEQPTPIPLQPNPPASENFCVSPDQAALRFSVFSVLSVVKILSSANLSGTLASSAVKSFPEP
jgi:hypothetical protein